MSVAVSGVSRSTSARIALADAVAGTTVGTAAYPVPAGAIVVSPTGRDDAAGTASAPLLTLGHAIAVASSGATIVMRAGSYHESVVIPSDKRLTIQSWPNEAVWLDGSVPVTSWTASGARWHTPWTVKFDDSPTFTRGAADSTAANWGFVNPAYPMAAHPDQIWVAGAAQRQVGSLAQVGPGTFFYDSPANTMWLGTNPAGQAVRASTLVTAMQIRSSSSIVRGIGIRRYAPSVPDMGAVTVERPNVLIENVAITDSATTGLHVGTSSTTSGVVLRNVTVANSGMLGISATYADNLTLDQVLAQNNNTEHFNTAPVSGGVKIARTRGIVVRNSVMRNNDGPGLWLDESSYNATITGNDIRDNTKHGISLEISAKATVTGNTVVANGGFGIKVNNTASVTISNNTFDLNRDRSINLVQDTRRPTSAGAAGRDPRQPFPDPTMTWLLGPVTVTNNVIANQTGGTCMLCVEDYTQARSAAQIGVTANGDTYVRPNAAIPTYLIVWSHGPGNPAVFQSLTSFRSATGQEAAGVLTQTMPSINPTTTPTTGVSTSAAPTTEAPLPTDTTTNTDATTTTDAPATTAATSTTIASEPTRYASDAFERTVVNGFGTADVGGPWTLSGPAPSFSVAGGAGRITGSVRASRGASLGVAASTMDIRIDLTLDTASSGGGAYVSVIGRQVSNGNDYRLKVRYLPNGAVTAYLVRTLGGTETLLAAAAIPGLTVQPGDPITARFAIGGTAGAADLAAKVWRAGDAEPGDWQLTATDATPTALQAPGDAGILLYVSGSWVAAAPTLAVDNLAIDP